MYNRAWHYSEAMRLVEASHKESNLMLVGQMLMEAQVHATLAGILDLTRLQFADQLLPETERPHRE